MRRELILIAFTTLTSLSVYAQISGVVVDSHSQPLSYANVSLYSLPDSTLISGTITNANGQFSFDHANRTGHECLKVSAIGYITAFVSPVKSKQTVQMQSNEYALNEVVVSGREIYSRAGVPISSPTSSTHVCVILALLMIYSTSCPWSQERKEIIKSLGKALPLSMWAIESLSTLRSCQESQRRTLQR